MMPLSPRGRYSCYEKQGQSEGCRIRTREATDPLYSELCCVGLFQRKVIKMPTERCLARNVK